MTQSNGRAKRAQHRSDQPGVPTGVEAVSATACQPGEGYVPPQVRYTLTVPSLSFAGLLSTWANVYDIAVTHNVQSAADSRYRSNKVPKRGPVVFSFESAADRTWLMEIARAKIALLARLKAIDGRRVYTTPDMAAIVARLLDAYKEMS